MVHQDLQDFHFLEGLTSHFFFHFAEAVENGGSVILIEGVDFGPLLKEEFGEIGGGGVEVGGVEDEVVEGSAFVHVLEVGVDARPQQILYLFQSEHLASLDYFDERGLILSSAEVDFALVLPQNHHKLVFALEGRVDDWQGLMAVLAVGVQSVGQQVLQDVFP